MSELRNSYPLRLPHSLKQGVSRMAKRNGTSVNHFITVAIAEKIAAMEAGDFFAERIKRADFETFRALLNRSGGEPPRPGDER
jgi:predicted DNA-binding protein